MPTRSGTFAVLLLLVLFHTPARGGAFTWVGGAPSGAWSSIQPFPFLTTNWGTTVLMPPSSSSTDLNFQSGGGDTTQDLANPFRLNSLQFTSAAFTINGSPLLFAADGSTAPSIVQAATNSQIINTAISLGADLSIRSTQGNRLTLNGVISDSGGTRSVTIGSNTVGGEIVFGGVNTHSGRTTVTGGTLTVLNGATLGNRVDLWLTTDDGVDSAVELGSSQTIGSLNGGSTTAGTHARINLDTGVRLTLDQAVASTYSGSLNGNGYLQKQGPGALTLGQNSGTLSGIRVTGSGSVAGLGGVNLTLNSTATDDNAAVVVDAGGQLTLLSGGKLNTPGATAYVGGPLEGSEQLVTTKLGLTGSGTQWTGAGSKIVIGRYLGEYGDVLVQQGASMNVGVITAGAAGWGYFNVSSGATVTSDIGQLAQNVNSEGGALVDGQGSKWTLNQRLDLGTTAAGAKGEGTLTVSNGGVVKVNGTTTLQKIASAITLDHGTLDTALLSSPAGVGAISNGGSLVVDGTTGSASYSGSISGSGGVSKSGDSTQTLSGSLSYTGATTISGGTLILSGAAPSGDFTVSNGTLKFVGHTITPGAHLLKAENTGVILYDGATVQGGSLSGSGKHQVTDNGVTFNATSVAAGAKLVIDSQATATVANNTSLDINGAQLLNNGTITGTTNAHTNAVVAGTGRFDKLNLLDNARLAPGAALAAASPPPFDRGILTANAVSFASASAFEVQGNFSTQIGQGPIFDRLNVNGPAALAGTLAVSNAPGFASGYPASYTILTYASHTGHFTSYTGIQDGPRYVYAPVYSATDLKLVVATPGDATLDGNADFNDLVKLAQNYNTTLTGDNGWTNADFNLDGKVDFNDLVILAQHYNTNSIDPGNAAIPAAIDHDWIIAQSSVPEPSAAGALILITAAQTIRCRRPSFGARP